MDNTEKYQLKIEHISKVLLSIDSVHQPAVIGLCEVENKNVLADLINNTDLNNFNYRVIHKDSPDFRGIDCAAIYRDDLFTPIKEKYIQVIFPFDSTYTTREILYIKGLAFNTDTMHLFVNHWTSRWGGQEVTEGKRMYIAGMLKTMSHPIRLKILCLLQDKEMTVGDIREEVKTTNANVSQHLNILRSQGIIDYRKDANFIYNRIQDPRIIELMGKMQTLFCPSI